MKEYKDISELLESDSRAMAFYNSLSLPMQRRLHSKGVKDLKQLYDCAADSSPGMMNTASASEAAGCVPSGGDMSPEEWEDSMGLSR